jgi:amidase
MSADAPKPLLEIDGLKGGYGAVPVLHGVSLKVNEGEVVGLLGHNGMGKSTLLRTIMGFLPATGGSIRFDGEDITKAAPFKRARMGLGYVPQGRGIFPALSTLDNLRFAWNGDGIQEDEAIRNILQDFPRLEALLDRQAGQLSGGEQQILALARCLIADPVMLLLDEPTEGIQPSIIEEIEDILARLRKEHQLTVLVVEQNLEFLSGLSDRLLIFEKGEIKGEVARSEMTGAALIEDFAGLGAARATRLSQAKPAAIRSSSPREPIAALREVYMTVRRPTLDQMRGIVKSLGMTMSDTDIETFMTLMEGTFQAYDRVDAMPDNLPKVKYPRTPGYKPGANENPLNAWYVKCEVRGASSGPIEGKKIVLKDNVCLAGVPMMNGASTLEGYTPDVDATIVTRILDAGGLIVGKAHCEYFCLSGGSHTNATGPVHNPWRIGYSAGGSSSGSAALVAAGEVPMAIGGDQGGSIRMPSSFCGTYGMKPTHGLVPYSGVMPIEPTIDHTGPMTATVTDNAMLLEVLAGSDGLDPRQINVKTDRYTAALGRGVSGLRIGIVSEGFGRPESERDVDQKVRKSAEKFRDLGAAVEEISIPMHRDGLAIWTPIALEGLTDIMMHGNGFGTGWEGLYVTSLLDAHANWRTRANELSHSLKISMFVGEYMLKHYRGHFYAKAQNLARQLRAAYDDTLAKFDLLIMPTTPMKATPLPPPGAPIPLVIQRAFEMIGNTAPFDTSGHPAMSIPCGLSEGLPVGMMIIGRHWAESTIYRAAHAFEQLGDWRKM